MSADRDRIRSCWATDRRRPECGPVLLTNGDELWCGFVGGGARLRATGYGFAVEPAVRGCDHGLDGSVKAEAKGGDR